LFRRFPKVDICLYQASRTELLPAIDSGVVDIAIVTAGEPNGLHDRSMAL
jgi:DNA-binding transcriptional LysR family regulator